MLVLKCTIFSKNLLELLLSLTFYSLPKEKISQLHVHHIHFTRLLFALLKRIKFFFFSPVICIQLQINAHTESVRGQSTSTQTL